MAGSYRDVPGSRVRLDISGPKERIDGMLDVYRNENKQTFEASLLSRHLKVVSASLTPIPTATFEMVNDREFCSVAGTMQGGAVAMILDLCTSMSVAAVAKKGFWEILGITRSLSVTYLRPIKLGAELVIECEILQIGNRLATLSGRIKDKSTGKLLAVGEQNQASVMSFAPEPSTKL